MHEVEKVIFKLHNLPFNVVNGKKYMYNIPRVFYLYNYSKSNTLVRDDEANAHLEKNRKIYAFK